MDKTQIAHDLAILRISKQNFNSTQEMTAGYFNEYEKILLDLNQYYKAQRDSKPPRKSLIN